MAVSLIIPTYNRHKILERLLIELNYQKGNFEVIVINDGSTDKTNEIFNNDNLWINYELKYIELRNHMGLPSVRNIGMEYSSNNIIGFMDDDCIPLRNDLLKRAYKWFKQKNRKIVAVGGPVYYRSIKPIPSNVKGSKKLIGRIKKVFPRIISNFNIEQKKPIFVETLPGGNMFLKKDAIEACGGFDPQFDGNSYREETDICMKLIKYGSLIFDPKMPVNHLRINSGGCRVNAKEWYTNIISNTILLILKNWGNFTEILSGTSTYFLRLVYECIKEMEDQRYYRLNRINLFRSIFKGFWRGFKKFFFGLNHIKSRTIKEERYFNPILENRLLNRDYIGMKAKQFLN